MPEDLEPLDPADILVHCALRFDAYQYLEDTGFNVEAAIDAYKQTETWDCSDEEKLAMFFTLQRSLDKWALVYEPYHGRWWRIFRQMFFDVVEIPLPGKYRYEQWADRWDTDFLPRKQEMIEVVRKKHESIEYDDNALPDFDGES
jgi:hypothetical protein